jgi:ABC-type transport system involved in cytochrome c biogenesis permease component
MSGTSAKPAPGPAPARAVRIVARYSFRACLPRKRRVGLLLPALGAVLFGLLTHAMVDPSREVAFANVASAGLFAIVVPIGCLVIGDAVLGAELRSGTLHFTLLSPIPRWTIVVGRWLAGALTAAVALAVACAFAAAVAGVPRVAPAMAVAVAAGSAAYVAVFIAVGCITRRAVVWSLAVVVLGERLLGAALDGIAQLSPGWLSRAAFGGMTGAHELFRKGVPFGWAAVVRLGIVTAVALVVAAARLDRLRVSGGSD